MKKEQNTTKSAKSVKTAETKKAKMEIKITGFLKGKIVKNLKAGNIAEMWREIQKVWAISRECKVLVKKNGEDFMKLWSEKRGEKWWQRNEIIETRRSKGGKKYQAAKAAEAETVQETEAIIPVLPKDLEIEPEQELAKTAEA